MASNKISLTVVFEQNIGRLCLYFPENHKQFVQTTTISFKHRKLSDVMRAGRRLRIGPLTFLKKFEFNRARQWLRRIIAGYLGPKRSA